LEEREQIFREAGADFVFELPFSEIKGLSPQEFVALLEAQFAPKSIVCGEDFRFGAGALGTAESLQALSLANVTVLPLIELEGSKVSSSTVKELIALGGLEKANAMLSHPFFLLGKVETGRKIGRTIGFPTANMSYPAGKFLLPLGVYETRVLIDETEYKAITNLGAQPTVGGGQVCVGSFVVDFHGDLYGKQLRVSFVRKIREIKKFDSVEQLKDQLQICPTLWE
jgi:riboflavin kinase/FMN adenylyltransferase